MKPRGAALRAGLGRPVLTSLLAAAALVAAACGSTATAGSGSAISSTTHVITDTMGRKVRVPTTVTRVATIGTIPVMISYVFAVGEEKTIVTQGGQSGSDSIAANGTVLEGPAALYKAFAPNIVNSTAVEDAINAPVNGEELLTVNPQVVIAPNLSIAQPAVNAGIPVVILQTGATGADVKQDVSVMAALFNVSSRSAAYNSYFDSTVKQVEAGVANIPASQRVSAVFLAFSPLRVPVYSTNYMFPIDGATSVTANETQTNVQITQEQLLAWNPDVIVVQQAADQQALYTDSEYSSLKAVQDHRVYLIPQGLQPWTDNSPEMPLGLLFLAKMFYPNNFTSVNLTSATRSFYQQFYKVNLSNSQIASILKGSV
jgi:iron complex transport system substrate-binding protein